MTLSKFQNHFTVEEAVGRMTIAVCAHPFDLCKTLIQLGYEPLPPKPVRTIFRTTKLAYPSVFTYLSYIRKQDGFTGIFRGLRYKLMFTLVNGFVQVNLTEALKQYDRRRASAVDQDAESEPSTSARTQEEENRALIPTRESVKALLDQLMRETFIKFLTMGISYPLQLLVIRSYAQLVGHETVYDSLSTAISDIYQHGGVCGFYAGFVPKFFGDVIILWTGHSLIFMAKRFIDSDTTIHNYLSATINFIVTSFMYPFQVVGTIMAVNGSEAISLKASTLSPDFHHDWGNAWKYLAQCGQIKRGSSLLWRYHTPTTNWRDTMVSGDRSLIKFN